MHVHGVVYDVLFFAFCGMMLFGFIAIVFVRSTIMIRPGKTIGPTYWGHYEHAAAQESEEMRKIKRNKVKKPWLFGQYNA